MKKIVLVGTSTPLQKVLTRINQFKNIQFVSIFTNIGKSAEIERLGTSLKIPISNIEILKTQEGLDSLKNLSPDWIFSVNSTVIFSPSVLMAAKEGSLNLHPGKLPEYAGLHTHQWAIRQNEKIFGATLHWMEPSVDAGDIALEESFPITPNETGVSLFMKCIQSGTNLAEKALEMIDQGIKIPKIKQNLSTRKVYRHRDALDGEVNWDWNAEKISAFYRAADYRPFQSPTYVPSASINGVTYRILNVTVGELVMNPPGVVLETNGNKIHVATGEGTSVWMEVKKI